MTSCKKIIVKGFLGCNRMILFLLLVLQAVSAISAPGLKQPNIILILADDMGYSDLGIMGSEIHTPNLDRLAGNGLLMTQFYNAGRCCPTRASLLTGLYAHQAGIGDMTENRGYPAYQGFLNKSCVTLAEALQQAGYTTAMTGKWHVGEAPEYWPQRRGFTHFFGIPQGGGAYFYPFLVKRELWQNDQVITPSNSFYSTEAFNAYAVRFIQDQQNADKPFFLYLAHIAPHFPLQAQPEDIARYRGRYKAGFAATRQQRWQRQQQAGLFSSSVKSAPPDELLQNWSQLSAAEQDTLDLKMAIYAAQITCMDRGIGAIVQKLKETGQLENTLILFLSDNGGEAQKPYHVPGATGPLGSATSWDSYGPSWAYVSNTPFRKYKKYVHEGGIRTPLIIHYPALMRKPRRETQQIGHVIDIMPTLLQIANASYPKEYNGRMIKPMAGTSLLLLLQGKELPGRTLFWEHEGNRGVRDGNWKLVSAFPENVWHLYDLQHDPTELNDLATANPDKAETLKRLYGRWAMQNQVLPWNQIIKNKN